ncbi:MAG: helix-hairpin-helix domain-containing protein [Clostridia bacterium]|nr:helix-hairpin-helix domain-containing protein [Clostridia bacterium]
MRDGNGRARGRGIQPALRRLKNIRLPAAWGMALTALAVALCLLSLKDAPRGLRQRFDAAGAEPFTTAARALPGGTVSINEAEADELLQLPGIGETLAAAIQDEIAAHGPFYYPEDLMSVRGIGESKFRNLLPYLHFDEEGE